MQKPFQGNLSRLDKIGIFFSSVCAIHCLLAPLVVFTFPFLITSVHSNWFHIVVAMFVVPVGLVAFHRGYKRHHDKRVLFLGWVGLGIITVASVIPHLWLHWLGHTAVMVTGSSFLILAHGINYKVCKGCIGHAHHHGTTTNLRLRPLKTFVPLDDDQARAEHS